MRSAVETPEYLHMIATLRLGKKKHTTKFLQFLLLLRINHLKLKKTTREIDNDCPEMSINK